VLDFGLHQLLVVRWRALQTAIHSRGLLHAELGALVHQLVGAEFVLNGHNVIIHVLVPPHVPLQHLVFFPVGLAADLLFFAALATLDNCVFSSLSLLLLIFLELALHATLLFQAARLLVSFSDSFLLN